MNKYISIALAISMVLSIMGCRGTKSSDSNVVESEEINSTEDDGGEVQTIAGLQFGGFENVGNDPNNLYQNAYNLDALAFDEEHIYFNVHREGIYSMDHSGTSITKITEENGVDLNVYDGYLYYITSLNNINRINLETLVLEEDFISTSIMNDVTSGGITHYGYDSIESIFIADDVLYYSSLKGYSGTSEGKRMNIYAVNLNDLTEHQIYSDKNSLDDPYYFTYDGEYVYALKRAFSGYLRISSEEVKNATDKTQMEEIETVRRGHSSTLIFAKNGFSCFIDDEETYNAWVFNSENEDMRIEEPEEIFNLETVSGDEDVLTYNPRYMLNNNLFIFDKREGAIVFCKNMDMNEMEEIGMVNDVMCSGKYNEKLYIIDSSSGYRELIIVDSNGDISSKKIQ